MQLKREKFTISMTTVRVLLIIITVHYYLMFVICTSVLVYIHVQC